MEKKINGLDQEKNVLWKYDSELGWAYFCPNCKKFLNGEKKCDCGKEIDWSHSVQYKGKVKWS